MYHSLSYIWTVFPKEGLAQPLVYSRDYRIPNFYLNIFTGIHCCLVITTMRPMIMVFLFHLFLISICSLWNIGLLHYYWDLNGDDSSLPEDDVISGEAALPVMHFLCHPLYCIIFIYKNVPRIYRKDVWRFHSFRLLLSIRRNSVILLFMILVS